jgi:hypothetical protein
MVNMSASASLIDQVLNFILRGEGDFDDLALRVFAYQFERNVPYRRLCVNRHATPETVTHWRQIPAAPTMAFKYVDLACEPIENAERVFISSGTTQGEGTRSRHFMFDLRLYCAAMRGWFAKHLLPEIRRRPQGAILPIFVLMPSPEELPNSSLAFMLGDVLNEFGAAGSDFFVRDGQLKVRELAQRLRAMQEPVCLLGTSLSFAHFLDVAQVYGWSFHLPPGSRLMDTGGFKGKSRETPRVVLNALYYGVFGIPSSHCINEYGMCEMSSQFYDGVAGVEAERVYQPPPWVRTVVVDPETLEESPPGTMGMLRHYDLANVGSVMAIQTEDLGYATDNGFVLVGRSPGSEPRGCSLMMDELTTGF